MKIVINFWVFSVKINENHFFESYVGHQDTLGRASNFNFGALDLLSWSILGLLIVYLRALELSSGCLTLSLLCPRRILEPTNLISGANLAFEMGSNLFFISGLWSFQVVV